MSNRELKMLLPVCSICAQHFLGGHRFSCVKCLDHYAVCPIHVIQFWDAGETWLYMIVRKEPQGVRFLERKACSCTQNEWRLM